MKNQIVISKLDYSRLNSMILNLLDNKNSNLFDLNRLNMEIKRAKLVEPKKIKPDYITMNSVIKVVFSESGIARTIRLSYPNDANLKEGAISVLSPLGCALLGYRKGEAVSFKAPGGTQTVIIDKVLYQPEANGEDLNYQK
ncbi:MAG TPA: GreA/GreB family elongation factor [Bacteroidales bacterium]|nr:GreA/GreB family elongation factor [Bacteroidales bacterium]